MPSNGAYSGTYYYSHKDLNNLSKFAHLVNRTMIWTHFCYVIKSIVHLQYKSYLIIVIYSIHS